MWCENGFPGKPLHGGPVMICTPQPSKSEPEPSWGKGEVFQEPVCIWTRCYNRADVALFINAPYYQLK